jgi:hypothetical protein
MLEKRELRVTIIDYATRFETHLTNAFAAEGKGLRTKLSSVENKLSQRVIKVLTRLAKVRNGLVHNENFEVWDAESLLESCKMLEIEFGLPPLRSTSATPLSSPTQEPPKSTIVEAVPLEVIRPSREITPLLFSEVSIPLRLCRVLAAFAAAMLIISFIGKLFFGGFTTTVEVGFDIPHGFWPFNSIEHATRHAQFPNGWYYLMWTSIWAFVASVALKVCDAALNPKA